MRVASRIKGPDLFESVIVDLARQDEVTGQIRFARRSASEAHPRLNDDPRFLRNHARTTAGAHESRELLKIFLAGGSLWANKLRVKICRKNANVPTGQALAALWAFPERTTAASNDSCLDERSLC